MLFFLVPLFAQGSLNELHERLIGKIWVENKHKIDTLINNDEKKDTLKYLFNSDNSVTIWENGQSRTSNWSLTKSESGLDNYIIIDKKKYIIAFVKNSSQLKLRDLADSKSLMTTDTYFIPKPNPKKIITTLHP